MTNLREARDKGKIEEFIAEREAEEGDAKALDQTISAMARKSSEVPQPSSPNSGDD